VYARLKRQSEWAIATIVAKRRKPSDGTLLFDVAVGADDTWRAVPPRRLALRRTVVETHSLRCHAARGVNARRAGNTTHTL
jgi:hypothetical protein